MNSQNAESEAAAGEATTLLTCHNVDGQSGTMTFVLCIFRRRRYHEIDSLSLREGSGDQYVGDVYYLREQLSKGINV